MPAHNGNQKRVMELTEQGMSASQIGKALGIATNTVYVHRHKGRLSQQRIRDQSAGSVQTRASSLPETFPSEDQSLLEGSETSP